MLSNKYTHAALLNLLPSSRSIAASDNNGHEGEVNVGVAGTLNTASSDAPHQHGMHSSARYGLRLEPNVANVDTSFASECVPFASLKAKNKKGRSGLNDIKVDVGILTSKRNRCPGSKETCNADASSSLGGRCVVKDSSYPRRLAARYENDEKLATCIAKCPTSKLCDYMYGAGGQSCQPETIALIAASCENGDHLECLEPYERTVYAVYKCPLYECLHTHGITCEQDAAYTCTCISYKSVCDFCKENSSFSGCLKHMNSNCEEVRTSQTMHYGPTCIAYFDENGLPSKDKDAPPVPREEGSPSSGGGLITYHFCAGIVVLIAAVLKSFQ